MIEGFPCYAPELAYENDGMDAESFERLLQIEERSFWFKVRNQILERLIRHYLGTDGPRRFLEVGCVTGYVTRMIQAISPEYEVLGAEIHLNGLRLAQTRLPTVKLMQMDARAMPFETTLDAVGMFDVLEHISEDRKVLRNIYNSLQPGGYYFLTVPQHRWLWSPLDDYSDHKRRYTRQEMRQKLTEAGFEIQLLDSYIFFLLPAIWLQRKLIPENQGREAADRMPDTPLLLEQILGTVTRAEDTLRRFGLHYPVGSSLIAVAHKPATTQEG